MGLLLTPVEFICFVVSHPFFSLGEAPLLAFLVWGMVVLEENGSPLWRAQFLLERKRLQK